MPGSDPLAMPGWGTPALGVLLLLLVLALLLRAGARRCERAAAWGAPSAVQPLVTYTPSALASYLLQHCSCFRGPCGAPWPWRCWPSLQTAVALLAPAGSGVRFVREHLQLSDEGLIALDWAVGLGDPRRRASSSSSAPVLLCVPNSFGRVTRHLTQMCQLGLARGYHPVIFNRRCHNECPLNTVKLQPFGDPSDLREAVHYIRHRHPASRLFAVAESTGAGLLFSYLGECGSSSYVTAAACISPLLRPQDWFEEGCPWLWEKVLLFYQKCTLSRYATALGELVGMEKVLRSRSLKELEETLFCEVGHISWESYWERNDPLRDVDEVATPVLCICSRDDPIQGNPETSLPFELFETNPHLFLMLTRHGGHCGFLGTGPMGVPWSHVALLDFFKSTLDFFLMEERLKDPSKRKRVGSGVLQKAPSGASVCRQEPTYAHNMREVYKWKRSYTR